MQLAQVRTAGTQYTHWKTALTVPPVFSDAVHATTPQDHRETVFQSVDRP
jgi:hypothetical protein